MHKETVIITLRLMLLFPDPSWAINDYKEASSINCILDICSADDVHPVVVTNDKTILL